MSRSMVAVREEIAAGWVVPGLSKAIKRNEGKARHE